MFTLHCIALVVYMEGRNQPEITQTHLASFVIEKAIELNEPVCTTLKRKNLYSWNWDGKATPVDTKLLQDKIYPVVSKELRRKHRSLQGYKFFNVCKGKKFPGRVLKSNDVCFYTGAKHEK